MCPIVFAGFAPHPPLLIEGVGDELKPEAAQTDQAYRQLAARLVEANPDTVIIVTPHGPVFSDAYTIPGWDSLKGDFTPFGSPVSMTWEADIEYSQRAEALAAARGLPLLVINSRQLASHRYSTGLDHGTMVPLWYLREAGWQGKVVCIRMGGLPPGQCYEIGKVLRDAAKDQKTALIASGDLSHCLSEDGPSPYNPAGAEFDQTIAAALEKGDYQAVLAIPPEFRQRAAECGWRPLVTLLGALDGRESTSQVLSYQGPFGVGYLIAVFALGAGDRPGLTFPQALPADASVHVQLARKAIRHYLLKGRAMDLPAPQPPLDSPAAAFVSLKLDDQLRGCMGTIEPEQDNLGAEIIANAIAAATGDPRFEPVTPAELEQLSISVDVLSEPVPADYSQLNPAKLGLVAQWRGRRGLLLPDLPGVDTPQEQLEIVCSKAGIPWEKAREAKLFTFTVERFY